MITCVHWAAIEREFNPTKDNTNNLLNISDEETDTLQQSPTLQVRVSVAALACMVSWPVAVCPWWTMQGKPVQPSNVMLIMSPLDPGQHIISYKKRRSSGLFLGFQTSFFSRSVNFQRVVTTKKFLGGRHNLWRPPEKKLVVATTCGDYPKFLGGCHNLWRPL